MTVRVGITGTGIRSAAYANAARNEDRASLAAVHDPLPEPRDRFAAEHGVEFVCATFDELLERVDLVVLTSPQQYHAPQSCEALGRGIHVLSEVPAAASIEQAQELVAAVRASDALYAMAENQCYTPWNVIVRELVWAGELGDLYYGESDYLNEVKAQLRLADGQPTWKYHWWAGRDGNTYPTHSLGPLLQWFEDRVSAVSCVGAGRHTAPEHELQDTTVLLARTVRGSLLRLRFSWLSERPRIGHHYAVQGTKGAYDQGSGLGAQPAVYLHGRSPADTWEPLDSLAERFLPDGYPPRPEWTGLLTESLVLGGFLDSALDGRPLELDVYASLDMTLPGLLAETSIAEDGVWTHVPNPRFFTAGIGVDPGREAPLA